MPAHPEKPPIKPIGDGSDKNDDKPTQSEIKP